MRKVGAAFAAFGLAALGLTASAGTAQAADGCNSKWPGRDGYVRAWDGKDCQGTLLGGTQGNDGDWGDGAGAFRGSDDNRASSVMNSGYYGGRDVVAFYWIGDNSEPWKFGYGCLKPGEFYVDDLSRNRFTPAPSGTRYNMNNSISSHRWVTAGDCRAGSFIS
ncbi:hypothetical protein CIB93_15085 [Streptomyces sp. WZ.A104]|uniref:hypothetical protein n=1 Tax=Streptomyces sp. WZ.A104 TaxID=2023771 RepID=UPI000BBBB82E|nr:hypothetical protein [Streptomyces sp. WZ.A104]PCG85309.1 hypothetical protein CIB93_15085 [Streptomyces sp. WZ.A104]